MIESVLAQRVLWPKGLREAVAPPQEVLSYWAGPPELPLDERSAVLRSVRKRLADLRFELAASFGGSWRYRRSDRSPVVVAEDEEAQADAGGHWWLSDLVWTHDDGTTFVARHDPDGNDLVFGAWGSGARSVLEEVGKVLPTSSP